MKIKYTYILSSIILIFCIIVFYKYSNTYKINEYTPEEARKRIEKGYYDVVIDVRTEAEWNEGHHPKAIHMPIDELVTELPKQIPDKNTRILFVCKKGIRSAGAALIAQKKGYKNIDSVKGEHNGLRLR
jgi:rhodanese-related sulfurtransferase